MSVQKAVVLVPPLRPVPPGAAWIADAIGALFDAVAGLAARLSRRLAVRHERAAAERAVRRDVEARLVLMALARRYESSQPEFAKDLYAAARSDRQV